MGYYLLACFYFFIAIFFLVLGIVFWKAGSVSGLAEQAGRSPLGTKLSIISRLFGEHWGLLWIRLLGVLSLATTMMLCGAGFYAVVEQPPDLFTTGAAYRNQQEHERLVEACKAGDGYACVLLGTRYEQDLEYQPADPERAAELYKRACDLGNIRGCWYYGVKLHGGQGVQRDTAGALRYYEQACNSGYVVGCMALARTYEEGVGVARDPARAEAFWERACEIDSEFCPGTP